MGFLGSCGGCPPPTFDQPTTGGEVCWEGGLGSPQQLGLPTGSYSFQEFQPGGLQVERRKLQSLVTRPFVV